MKATTAIRERFRLLLVAAAVASGIVGMGMLPTTQSYAGEVGVGYYCFIEVPTNTDCANISGGSWSNGRFDQNTVAAGAGGEVCEHTYYLGTGTTVSRRCGSTRVDAATDLFCPYDEGYSFSGHAGRGDSPKTNVGGETEYEYDTCV
jgi:hypothetical protein